MGSLFIIFCKFFVVLFLGSIATILFITGVKIIFADKSAYKSNMKATGKIFNPIKGKVPTFRDGSRDHTVCAGLGYDLKTNQFIEQGTLSDESAESVLR